MVLWIVHRYHRQFYHRKYRLKCCAEFAQNLQKWCAEFANHACRICNFLVHNSDVPSNIHQDAKGTVEGDMLEGGQRTLPTHSARYTVLKSDTPNHDDNATRT